MVCVETIPHLFMCKQPLYVIWEPVLKFCLGASPQVFPRKQPSGCIWDTACIFTWEPVYIMRSWEPASSVPRSQSSCVSCEPDHSCYKEAHVSPTWELSLTCHLGASSLCVTWEPALMSSKETSLWVTWKPVLMCYLRARSYL